MSMQVLEAQVPAKREGYRGGEATRFKPGNRANPSGRPKQNKTLKALAVEQTETAIRTLVEICKDKHCKSPSARVQAAQALLDRGHGKPLQQIEIGEAGAFSDLSEAELDRFIEITAQQLRQITAE